MFSIFSCSLLSLLHAFSVTGAVLFKPHQLCLWQKRVKAIPYTGCICQWSCSKSFSRISCISVALPSVTKCFAIAEPPGGPHTRHEGGRCLGCDRGMDGPFKILTQEGLLGPRSKVCDVSGMFITVPVNTK